MASQNVFGLLKTISNGTPNFFPISCPVIYVKYNWNFRMFKIIILQTCLDMANQEITCHHQLHVMPVFYCNMYSDICYL